VKQAGAFFAEVIRRRKTASTGTARKGTSAAENIEESRASAKQTGRLDCGQSVGLCAEIGAPRFHDR
jgi:hypothetical protein